ncbi:MAG TPA: hypothetical protein VF092_31305 [Longimicrobium sp.]
MSEPRSKETRAPLRSVVISREGAVLHAELILLDEETRRRLTAENVTYLRPAYIPGGRRGKK